MFQSSSIHIHSWYLVWSVWIPWVLIAYQKFQTIQLDWLCEGFIIGDLKGLLIHWKHAWRNIFWWIGVHDTAAIHHLSSHTFTTHHEGHRKYMAGSLCASWNPQQSDIQPQILLGSYYRSISFLGTLRHSNSGSKGYDELDDTECTVMYTFTRIFSALFISFSMYTTTVVIDSFICWIYLFLISLSSQYGSLDSNYFEVSPAKSTHVLYVVSICRGVAMSFYQ